jgi:hypothetical protein
MKCEDTAAFQAGSLRRHTTEPGAHARFRQSLSLRSDSPTDLFDMWADLFYEIPEQHAQDHG